MLKQLPVFHLIQISPYSFTSTKVDKTQLCVFTAVYKVKMHLAQSTADQGDETEKDTKLLRKHT